MSHLSRLRAAKHIKVVAGIVAVVLAVLVWAVISPVAGQQAPLNPLGVVVVGQTELLANSRAGLRIVATDHERRVPATGALISVRIAAVDSTDTKLFFVGRTDAKGTVQAGFDIPNLEPGQYDLIIRGGYRGYRDEVRQTVTIQRGYQVLLTTDKPIYQPTQTMHLRALALRRPDLHAVAAHDLTLEVSDAKGNKVFKKVLRTNKFGIAAADFILADEVNMGRYTIRALVDDQQTEKKVTVKRYVLPKFKVILSTNRDYYLPGSQVEGTVQADYFFGKPVAGGQVEIIAKTFDVEYTEIAHIEGKTDDQGTYRFDLELPTHFVGQPLEQGNAFLEFDVKVTDQAEHTEEIIKTSTVAASHIMINAVPEAGKIVPNVENVVYILTSQPDGKPQPADITIIKAEMARGTVQLAETDLHTNTMGIAQIAVQVAPTPVSAEEAALRRRPVGRLQIPLGPEHWAGEQNVVLTIAARTAAGWTAEKQITLSTADQPPTGNILLRTDAALYEVGGTIDAVAYTAPAKRGTVYFDVIKDRQTMFTYAAEVKLGQARVHIPLPSALGGSIYLSAYRIMPDGQIVRDTRPLFVEPAADLNIDIAADKDTYLPGGEARLGFTVTDTEGRPVAAALGINVVDEAVFALQELQPGMEKVYFYLEKELMKPRYEIHGLEMATIVTRPPGRIVPLAENMRKQQAARIMFASVEIPELPTFQQDSYAERLQKAREQWAEQLRPQVERIQRALQQYINQHDGEPPSADDAVKVLLQAALLREPDLRDPWGNRMTLIPASDPVYSFIVFSPGPDGEKDTEDDFYIPSQVPEMFFQKEAEARQPWRFAGRGGFGAGDVLLMEGLAIPAPGAPMVRAAAKAALPPTPPAGGEMPAKETVRIREYFPETLFFEPALITGGDGKATLTVPMADSITTWRLAAMANSAIGQLGSTTKGLRCFQDFFIDIDLPVSLTQNDQVSIPIAVYNYLPDTQTVRLELTTEDWFDLKGEAIQEINIAANDVEVRYFTIVAQKLGDHKLTVHGLGTQMSDAISREIRIEPDGKKVEQTINARLTEDVSHTVTIPTGAIDDASKILVKIYPGIFSQAVEGLDSMLRMPFGCFEQTASVTYPNVLVMDYMKSTQQINPEIQMKAEGFINHGYQRLVSYEVAGGGFSWFGDPPANKILTTFGLMCFYDMEKVYAIDQAIISRTQRWLADQQEDDGSWTPDEEYLHQSSWNRIQLKHLPPTAYVTWGLAWSEYRGAALKRAVGYVRENQRKADDPYTLSMVANALVAADNLLRDGKLQQSTLDALERLLQMAKEEDQKMWWETKITGITHSSGQSADLETTGMAAIAFITSGRYPQVAGKVLNYLIANKDPQGTWHSTQATILALRALLLAQTTTTTKVDATVKVVVNGQEAASFRLTEADADVLRQVDCKDLVKEGDNKVEIKFQGEGTTLYQIVSRYYVPWTRIGPPRQELLSINVDYDKTKLATDDVVTAAVTIRNNTPAKTSMIIVDLGIPPGFAVQTEDLTKLVEDKKIDKFNLTGRQIIVYLEKLQPNQTVEFSYTLQAKFPIKAKTPKSTVYEYYNPANRADAAPVEMEE